MFSSKWWNNKASDIKLVFSLFNYQDDARSNKRKMNSTKFNTILDRKFDYKALHSQQDVTSVSCALFMNFGQWMHAATWMSSENSSYVFSPRTFYLLCATYWKRVLKSKLTVKLNTGTAPTRREFILCFDEFESNKECFSHHGMRTHAWEHNACPRRPTCDPFESCTKNILPN